MRLFFLMLISGVAYGQTVAPMLTAPASAAAPAALAVYDSSIKVSPDPWDGFADTVNISGDQPHLLVFVAAVTAVDSIIVGGTTYGWTASDINSPYRIYLLSLEDPTSGIVSVSSSHFSTPADILIASISIEGVNASTPTGTAVTANGGSGTPTLNVSSATGEIVFDGLSIAIVSTVEPGAGQSLVVSNSSTTPDLLTSKEAGSATTTMSWTNPDDQLWALIGIAVKP